ncbi:CoA transferase [Cohnella pontilimi]|uniref:CoA transferase n=1 Tax=Cohnella pontilimi TaxID=2564100 RepID=A0A4U0FC92_9BACL|nr:CaiB/BaiF CoA-transferase family protein [Cohnella pontilimi]TJY42341.1 CoA transferase [Cohnella pontilimi]
MLPLSGITVVSLEQAIAAPFASRQLADLGARVIKAERPGDGDFARRYDKTVHGQSSYFVWLNRSKESLALDLKSSEGKHVLSKLLEKADVFLHNLAPGAVDRLGFEANMLLEKYPRIIVCSISGYGKSGPYREKKAYDLLIQCEAGLLSITGTPETPSKVSISIADISAGMYAFTGILTALFNRNKTGKGSVLEISMLEALAEWMGYPMYYTVYGKEELKRTGASHATICPYGPFQSSDGKTVFLCIQNEREWVRFCDQVLELPELSADSRFADNSSRVAHRDLLDSIVADNLQSYPAEVILERLDHAKIANARMNTMQEFFEHPQLEARGRWREVITPAGPVQALVPPLTMNGFEPVMNPVPSPGQHTEQILAELGLLKQDESDK